MHCTKQYIQDDYIKIVQINLNSLFVCCMFSVFYNKMLMSNLLAPGYNAVFGKEVKSVLCVLYLVFSGKENGKL